MNKVASPALKAVLITLVLSCLLLVVTAIQQALSGRYLPLLFAAVLWAPMAWGLWHLHPLARKVAVALLWLVIIVLPIGVINPFAAIDGAIDVTRTKVVSPSIDLIRGKPYLFGLFGYNFTSISIAVKLSLS
jgi:hypothetical protein